MMTRALPSHSHYVVIGGGIIGCSTAYHLAKNHSADVVVLEQGKLTSGSTWHAAGLVGQLRASATLTQLLKYSVELYGRLEQETGLATGWKPSGCLRLACSEDRMVEFRRQVTTAHSFGLEMELLSPQEVKRMWPLMEVSDLTGASFMPTDGQASPSDITQSLAKGARQHGASIFEEISVTDIEVTDGRVTAVETSGGRIACEKAVICCGLWSRQVGELAGVSIPLQAVQHQYIVTERVEGGTEGLATVRDPDRGTYFKEEVGGFMLGGYEPDPKAWAIDGIPQNFSFQLLEDDWNHFEQHLEKALERVPALHEVGVKSMINGPESFTPDGNFMLGETAEVRNLFVGAGFNAFGIAAGGGAGWALAEWVANGEQPLDLWVVDIRRFSDLHKDATWSRDRTLEAYGKHYTLAYPHDEFVSGRPRLKSPIYQRMADAGASFGSKLGWERPNWFAVNGEAPCDVLSFGRQNWFDAVGEEHRACRERAVIFDQSSFAKYEICGSDAEAALNWICANDVAKPPGKLTYTQMLNSRGGIECDLTVARLADDRFYLVTGTGFRTHDAAWIRQNVPPGLDVALHDITEQWGTLSLFGPNARHILSAVCEDDLSNAGFPFATIKAIEVAGYAVRALRVTYVGELGWELHMPADAMADVYDVVLAAGAGHGLAHAGYRALESLRLEKGYRAWGADISPSDAPAEAGLGWAVKLRSNTPFLGREASERIAAQPLKKKLACFTVADTAISLSGRETILRNGEVVGYLTSAGWGYTVEKSVGYGYVRHDDGVDGPYLRAGTYQLEVACQRVSCDLELRTLYDPDMKRVKI
jgi:4-methylaminobutanoate oxidase (formaldehyde-forming)